MELFGSNERLQDPDRKSAKNNIDHSCVRYRTYPPLGEEMHAKFQGDMNKPNNATVEQLGQMEGDK